MTRVVQRIEDMSTTGRLEILQQDDGDIIVSVSEDDHGQRMPASSVEFCIPGLGGGHSPRTHAALRALMDAMAHDNAVDADRLVKPRKKQNP